MNLKELLDDMGIEYVNLKESEEQLEIVVQTGDEGDEFPVTEVERWEDRIVLR